MPSTAQETFGVCCHYLKQMESRKKPQKAESTAVGNKAAVRSGSGTISSYSLLLAWSLLPIHCCLSQRHLYFLTQGLVIKGVKNIIIKISEF